MLERRELFLISSGGELLNDIEVSQTPLAEAIVGPDGVVCAISRRRAARLQG